MNAALSLVGVAVGETPNVNDARFVSDINTTDVAAIFRAPRVDERLGGRVGANPRVTHLQQMTYQVCGADGVFIVRFPVDEAHLAALKREESVQRRLRARVSLLIPDTEVIDDLDGYPAFAVHGMIPGEPLTSVGYAGLSTTARERLVRDLAGFFSDTHRIPLAVACEWLDMPFEGDGTPAKLASTFGKPTWFGPHSRAEIRATLMPLLDARERELLEDTIRLFEALETHPENMVFGHGDMHGYNMAIGKDEMGPRLVGAFDLGCTGILDVHEDFFRLSLISEDLLERVLETYHELTGRARALRRDRIAIYYRAFLFYLMAEQSGSDLSDLRKLLREHVRYYGGSYGRLS